MNHTEAIAYILRRLESELVDELTYHSISHTTQVLSASKDLAVSHELNEMDTKLLLTAAAYHDSGFLTGYENHEKLSCQIVRDSLPDFGYSKEQIDLVCEMIMATEVPQKPKNQLEKLLCDADLSYLSGSNYFSRAEDLFRELNAYGKTLNPSNWINIQINFLKAHSFWTKGSLQSQGDSNKQDVIRRLSGQLNG